MDQMDSNPIVLKRPFELERQPKICCPRIVSVKLKHIYTCRNLKCWAEFEVVDEGKKKQICVCDKCGFSTYKKNLHKHLLNVILEEKETGAQIIVVIVDPIILQNLGLDEEEDVEDKILSMKNYDFTIVRDRFVIKMSKHLYL